MDFGPVGLDAALGCILAHATGPLKKGMVPGDAEISQLQAAGFYLIVVARLAPDDLHENAAADRLARAFKANHGFGGIHFRRAATRPVYLCSTGSVSCISTPRPCAR